MGSFSVTPLHPESRLRRRGDRAAVPACRICGNAEGNAPFVAREMVLGFKDGFEYIQCARCGCLQIREFPADLDPYYPEDYFEYLEPAPLGALGRALKRARSRHALGQSNLLGRLLMWRFGPPRYVDWVRRTGSDYDTSFLDVGCGEGTLIVDMAECGFKNVTGIDARIDNDITYKNGARVLSKSLSEAEGEYDVVMMHHVFEHFDDPFVALAYAYNLVKPGGYLIIRTPVANCEAWEKYGVNWVQLDAPRHVFVHSPQSIDILAERAGFELKEIVFDSTSFQFWGSEQYERGIPLRDDRSYAQRASKSIFTPDDIEEFSRWADEKNEESRGDQAAFYLRRG